jgi:Arm DNA-binding domain
LDPLSKSQQVQGPRSSARANKINCIWARTQSFFAAGPLRDNIGGISVIAMIRLTEKQLAAAARPGPKPFEIVAGPIPGLRLVVHPSGVMSWCLRYRAGGRARKLVFARYPGLPLPEARKVAIGLYGQVASGRDPGAERKASRRREAEAKAPIRDLIEKIIRQYLRQAAKRTRASTAAEASRIFRVYVLPAWKGKRLSEIDKAEVRSLVAVIAPRAPVMAMSGLIRLSEVRSALRHFGIAPKAALREFPRSGLDDRD